MRFSRMVPVLAAAIMSACMGAADSPQSSPGPLPARAAAPAAALPGDVVEGEITGAGHDFYELYGDEFEAAAAAEDRENAGGPRDVFVDDSEFFTNTGLPPVDDLFANRTPPDVMPGDIVNGNVIGFAGAPHGAGGDYFPADYEHDHEAHMDEHHAYGDEDGAMALENWDGRRLLAREHPCRMLPRCSRCRIQRSEGGMATGFCKISNEQQCRALSCRQRAAEEPVTLSSAVRRAQFVPAQAEPQTEPGAIVATGAQPPGSTEPVRTPGPPGATETPRAVEATRRLGPSRLRRSRVRGFRE
eukprot:jgi/Ulvmu1/8646/UM046_0051.1